MSGIQEHRGVLLELLQELDRICKKHDIHYVLFAGTALGAVRHHGFIPWDDDLDVAMLREDYDRFMQVAPAELFRQYFLQIEFSEHWPMHFSKLRKNNTTCLEKYHPKDHQIHQGIYIDIFPLDNVAGNKLLRKLQFVCSKVVLAKTLFRRGYETDSWIKKLFIFGCRLLPLRPFYTIVKNKKAMNSQYVHSFLGGSSSYRKSVYPRHWLAETMLVEFEGKQFPISAHYDALLTTIYGDYMKLPDENERKIKTHALLVDVNKNYTEYAGYRDGMKFDVYTRSIR